MAKLCNILFLSSLLIALLPLAYSKPKETKIRFFLQDKFSGNNRTVYPVAQSDITATSPTFYGRVCVVDDPLTVGPKHTSKVIGQLQGIIAYADLKEQAIHVSVTIVFTSGKYKGSTLTAVGRNSLSQKFREVPIVGGTGVFKLARGALTTSTYSTEPKTNRATFEYNLAVTHG